MMDDEENVFEVVLKARLAEKKGPWCVDKTRKDMLCIGLGMLKNMEVELERLRSMKRALEKFRAYDYRGNSDGVVWCKVMAENALKGLGPDGERC